MSDRELTVNNRELAITDDDGDRICIVDQLDDEDHFIFSIRPKVVGRDAVVYVSPEAAEAIARYLQSALNRPKDYRGVPFPSNWGTMLDTSREAWRTGVVDAQRAVGYE